MADKTTAFTGPVVVGLNDKKGEIRLTDGKNVNEAKYLAIAAPDTITSDTTLTFPNGAGTAGQILSTDGNGTLSWVNDSAGNPAGTNGQVQTNDGGTFGAISEGTAGQILTSNGAGTAPTFQAAPTSGIAAVVDDTTPQLGGNLDLNNQTINGNGNISYDGNLSCQNGTIVLNGGHPNGFFNTAFGDNAGNSLNGNQSACTLVGYNSGLSLGICSNNTAFGHATLANNTTGSENTAVGSQTLDNVIDGSNNTGVGREAGGNITSGSNNTCIGADATASSPTVSNEVTIGDVNVTSLRIPGLQSGASANDVLTFNGTDITLAAPSGGGGGGLSWQPVITTNTTATASQGFFVNTSGGAVTLTLPATPTQGDEVAFVDYAGTAATNNITIGRNGENIQGSGSDLIINTNRAANTLVYADATQGWLLKNV